MSFYLFNEAILVYVNLAEGSGHRVRQPRYLHGARQVPSL
jgi:hypothetical protein